MALIKSAPTTYGHTFDSLYWMVNSFAVDRIAGTVDVVLAAWLNADVRARYRDGMTNLAVARASLTAAQAAEANALANDDATALLAARQAVLAAQVAINDVGAALANSQPTPLRVQMQIPLRPDQVVTVDGLYAAVKAQPGWTDAVDA